MATKKRYTIAEKIQIKEALETFILHPYRPCLKLKCTLCLVQKECASWANKKVKDYTVLGDYRRDVSIAQYKKQYGEAALFEILL